MELIEFKDMFGLYLRVKEIRPTYMLFFNRKTNMVELHDKNFGGKCMTFSLPINASIINKINATRIENANLIFRKIDTENSKNTIKTTQNAIELLKNTLYQN